MTDEERLKWMDRIRDPGTHLVCPCGRVGETKTFFPVFDFA